MSRIYSARDISSHEPFDKLHCVSFSCSSFSMNFNGMQWRGGEEMEKNVYCSAFISNTELLEKWRRNSTKDAGEIGSYFDREQKGINLLYIGYSCQCVFDRVRRSADDSSSIKNLNSMHMRFEYFQMKNDYFWAMVSQKSHTLGYRLLYEFSYERSCSSGETCLSNVSQ